MSAFLLPPGNLLLLFLLGLGLLRRRPRLARGLLVLATVGLWLLSVPVVANRLLASLEEGPPARFEFSRAQAIVVVGAGRYRDAPEYGGDTASSLALERLRYAAWLARQSHLPVLVSGGSPEGRAPEAGFMKQILEREFGVPVRWVEDASRNTWENAQLSRRLLAPQGIDTILLVTHAWHMPRARRAFEAVGFRVIPAGTRFHRTQSTMATDWLPDAQALLDSHFAFHEWLGLAWYRLRGRFG